MRTSTTHAASLVALSLLLPVVSAGADDVVLRAMKDELARTTSRLRLQEMERPYFVAYRVVDVDGLAVEAELGSLTAIRPDRSRRASVELRVGDPTVDNSNWVNTSRFGASGTVEASWAPIDDDYQQLRRSLWRSTDALYKRALEDLTAKRAVLRDRTGADAIPDFTTEPPTASAEPWTKGCPSRSEAEAIVRELSALFRGSPEIRASSARLECEDAYVRYLNSEGTTLARPAPRIELEVGAEARTTGGRPIHDSFAIHGRGAADLPPRESLLARARALHARLLALRGSPAVDRYTGPVLFEGVASAELFAQQLAPGFVATRQPVSEDPQFEAAFERFAAQMGGGSFADKIGASVLPSFLSVTDDPTRKELRGVPLLGARRFDDEGVAARATKLVERGRLKALLSTRAPARAAPRSTGSRRGWTAAPSNLVVTSEKALPKGKLRKELIRRARERGLEFAIVVRHVGAGASPLFRMGGRGEREGSNGATMPEVYRVFADGREELLHGMELAGLTPAAFKEIAAVGDAPAVHTLELLGGAGMFASLGHGAGEGMPLVSYVIPDLLFDEMTLVRSRAPTPEAPVTPSPLVAQSGGSTPR